MDGMDVGKVILPVESQTLSAETRTKIKDLMDVKTHIDGIDILELHRDSPALKSGIREGDMLIMMNNKIEMNSLDKYWIALNGFVPNEVVKYLILRWNEDKGEHDLMEFDVSICEPPTGAEDNILIIDQDNAFYGCLFGEIKPALGIEMGMNPCKEGIMLLDAAYSSFAANAGFETGDLLLEIDGQSVHDLDQLRDLNLDTNRQHNVVLQRGDMVGQINI